jgi:hypothetical protein
LLHTAKGGGHDAQAPTQEPGVTFLDMAGFERYMSTRIGSLMWDAARPARAIFRVRT